VKQKEPETQQKRREQDSRLSQMTP